VKVVTVTLNPALDQTVELDRLERGKVHRARSVRLAPGGKGINVASCLADWGQRVTVTGLLGRDNSAVFESMFAARGIEDRFVRADGLTRTNIKLIDEAETTDVNLPGLPATAAALDAVKRRVCEHVEPGSLVVLSGSLPPGCPDDHYAAQIAAFTELGARVLLDASGAALTTALAARPLPFCIKPNRHELAAWAGAPLAGLREIAATARMLHARGVALVVVSMGEDGALFVSDEGTRLATLRVAQTSSTVGAGDAMVAGIVAALVDGADLTQIARLSTAFAVAKLQSRGLGLPEPPAIRALAENVTVTTPAGEGDEP
jgi:1-phosphofructokinase